MNYFQAIRDFANRHQNGRCLVCPFPLALGSHLHHVIARDDRGPYHPLNLVALRPNHHLVLERIRRHISPKETHSHPEWLMRGQAALSVIDALGTTERRVFDQLSEPHPLRQPIASGVEPKFQAILAHDVALADVKILLAANLARPGALLAWRIVKCGAPQPQGPSEYQEAINALVQSPSALDVIDAVERHLRLLTLPFDRAWFSDQESSSSAPAV
jgi:hypothetical protein